MIGYFALLDIDFINRRLMLTAKIKHITAIMSYYSY